MAKTRKSSRVIQRGKAKSKPENAVAKRILATPIPTERIQDDLAEKDGLTMRQREFVRAITEEHLGNASAAARASGYSAENENSLRVIASRLVTDVNVQTAIRDAFAKKRLTVEWAKNVLYELGSASMANFIAIDDKGHASLDLDKAAAAGALGQICEWQEDIIQVDGVDSQIIKRKVKLSREKVPAIQTYLKLCGLLVDKHEHSGPDGGPIAVDTPAAIIAQVMGDPGLSMRALDFAKAVMDARGAAPALPEPKEAPDAGSHPA